MHVLKYKGTVKNPSIAIDGKRYSHGEHISIKEDGLVNVKKQLSKNWTVEELKKKEEK